MPTALYTTHTTNTICYTTLQWAFLLFQFNVEWFGLNRYCFLSTLQVSFWAHPKTLRYFLTSLFQERKVFLFGRILLKSKYFSEVDQVCTILSRVFPFRASTERGAQYQSSPFFSVAFDTAPRRVPGQGPGTLDDGASVTMRADAQFEPAANLSQNPCNLYQCMLSLSGVWLRPIRPIMTDLSMGLLCPEPDYNHKAASGGVNISFCKSPSPWIAGLGGRVSMLCIEAALCLACSRQLGRMALVAPVCLPIHACCLGTTNIQGNLVSPIFPALRVRLFWACQPFVMVLHVQSEGTCPFG